MSNPTETDWMALAMASESNEHHEWPYIGWVIRNRKTRRFRGAERFVDVILARKQFSYFDKWTAIDQPLLHAQIWEHSMEGYAGRIYLDNRHEITLCASSVINAMAWQAPFGVDVLHYYSPVSMKPKGSKPAWEPTAKRLFTPSGVDPNRFVFAAGVR